MGELLGLLAWAPKGWGTQILEGALVTVSLALATLPFGLAIGLLVALGKNSGRYWLIALSDAYTTIFRGLPELLTLLIIYYGLQVVIQHIWGWFFPDAEALQINSFFAGMIALGVVFSAYSSEVMYGALRGITRGQIEASRALGLSSGLTFRLIVVPQLWRFALPGLANLWMVLLKDTSLVSVIGLSDLLRNTHIAVGVTKQPVLFYVTACLIYLILSIISSVGVGRIEAWSERGLSRGGR